jgi:TRAP-type C4-dicarboxylate transport system permease small subunit
MTLAGSSHLLSRLRRLAEIISGLMFAGIFVVFLAGIVMRYVFSHPLMWGDELAIILMLWCTLFTDAFVVRSKDHVAFDVVWDLVSPKKQRFIGVVGSAIFSIIFLAALPTIFDYVLFLWRERTDVLEWRLDFVFSCFVLYIAMVIVRLVARLVEFSGANWREHVGAEDVPNTTNVIG